VPVEKDGSAFFEVPAGIPILFHAVNEKGAAVQGMRSLTYTAPGETLMCAGCHESRTGAAVRDTVSTKPIAMRREPSVLRPGPDGSNPFNYPRLVQPVLDARCVKCHGADRKEGMPDLRKGEVEGNRYRFHTSFVSLVPYVSYYTVVYQGPGWLTMGLQRDAFVKPFTVPGTFGSYASRLYAMLNKGHHDVKLTEEENLRLILFMDSNASYFGHDHELERQALGEIVHPVLQ
jgi:cytochrome c553